MMQLYKTEADLTDALRQLSAQDAPLAAAFQKYGTPPLRAAIDGCKGLVRLLISQQVSTSAAAAIQARFDALMGEADEAGLPVALLAVSDDALGACGISRPKQRYMRLLAEAIVSDGLDLEALRDADNETVYQRLTALKGIGPWTAQCYLLFSLRRADMFPAGDLALQHGIRIMYGLDEKPSAEEAADFSVRWQPHRGAAARLIWAFYNGESTEARRNKSK
jgi:DNA-3-methyladenine glycosylase II